MRCVFDRTPRAWSPLPTALKNRRRNCIILPLAAAAADVAHASVCDGGRVKNPSPWRQRSAKRRMETGHSKGAVRPTTRPFLRPSCLWWICSLPERSFADVLWRLPFRPASPYLPLFTSPLPSLKNRCDAPMQLQLRADWRRCFDAVVVVIVVVEGSKIDGVKYLGWLLQRRETAVNEENKDWEQR